MLNFNFKKDIPLWTNFITAFFSFHIGWFFSRRYSLKRNNSYVDSIDKSIDDLEKGLRDDPKHDKYTFMTIGQRLHKDSMKSK